MSARMWAWVCHGGGSLRLQPARIPALRGDDMLVRVHRAGINPIDLRMLEGYGNVGLGIQRRLFGEEAAAGELVAGRDFFGTVEQVAPGVTHKVGTFVWGALPPRVLAGTHAELVRVDEKFVGLAPSRLGNAAGGTLYVALSALAALRAAGVKVTRNASRNRVLLMGLGSVGQAALQLLVYSGASVTVMCAPQYFKLATHLGASDLIDRHSKDATKILNDAGPWQACIDTAGLGGAALGKVRARVASTLSPPLLARLDAAGLWAGAAMAVVDLAKDNRMAACGGPQVRWAFFSTAPTDIELMRRLAEDGELTIYIEKEFPWWQGREAYNHAAGTDKNNYPTVRGKVIMNWNLASPPDLDKYTKTDLENPVSGKSDSAIPLASNVP